MSIHLVGLNHHTAPVELREQLAFSRDGVATALMLFRNQFPNAECSILSTCNRVEMLVSSDGPRPGTADIVAFLAQARDLPVAQFRHCLYELSGEQAVRHFFRVASGLDSMVLGESPIVNQVKQAYGLASEQGATGRVLNRMFHHAFAVSKRVRSETEIGQGKLSVPAVAVEVARGVFDDFSTKQTLVVGAGEMAQLVCQYLRDADARRFAVTTRTLSNAKSLADACSGEAVPFDKLDDHLAAADIIITATACPLPFITAERIREAQKKRRGRLLFIIDLSVPRNVAPEAGQIEQVYLYDIDSLGRIVAEHQQNRLGQIAACEKILDDDVGQFEQWLGQTRSSPLIAQMYQDSRLVLEAELERLFNRCQDLTDDQRDAVTQAMDRLLAKFMHPCVTTIRRHSLSVPSEALAGAFHAARLNVRPARADADSEQQGQQFDRP